MNPPATLLCLAAIIMAGCTAPGPSHPAVLFHQDEYVLCYYIDHGEASPFEHYCVRWSQTDRTCTWNGWRALEDIPERCYR